MERREKTDERRNGTHLLPVQPPTLSFTRFPFPCADATSRRNTSGALSDPSHPSEKSSFGTANAKSIQSKRAKSTFSGGNASAVQSG